ncbi:hypothetical protein Q1695_000150 [Nippostrongylus brasiliensis]|nr:hypothetical protein Q1695_000150 [Nippostrongylus brasiliensis]
MDSLYLDTPRPFNKYPAGYRPMTGNGNAMRTMSTLSLYPSRPDSQWRRAVEPTNDFSQPSLPTSPTRTYDFQEDVLADELLRHRPPPTSASLDRRNSEQLRNSKGGASLLADLGQSDEFLKKLRQQREKIESYGRQREKERESSHQYYVTQPQDRGNEVKVAWRNGKEDSRRVAHQNPGPSPLLHKTRSDSSIFHDIRGGRASQGLGTANVPFPSENNRHSHTIERPASSAGRRAPMEGFFAMKYRQEPTWITNPPPPFDIQNEGRMSNTAHLSNRHQSSRNTFENEQSAHYGVQTAGNQFDPGFPRYVNDAPPEMRHRDQIPEIPSGYRNLTQEPHFVEQMPSHYTEFSHSVDRAYPSAAPRKWNQSELASMYYVPEHVHGEPSNVNQYANQSSAYGNDRPVHYGTPRTHADFHQSKDFEPLPEVSKAGDFRVDPSVYAAETKYFQSSHNERDQANNYNAVHYKTRQAAQGPFRFKHKSFAITSRPLTPPAILQNPVDVVDATYSTQHRRASPLPHEERSSRWSRPSSAQMSSVYSADSQSHNRLVGSPMSSYDNESEIDSRSQIYGYTFPSNQNPMNSTPNHGILRNNEGVSRPSKKVVFLCDSDGMDRYVPSNVASMDAPPDVKAYDSAMSEVIEQWSRLSDQLGGDVKIMAEKVNGVFNSLRTFLWTAASQPEPSADDVQKMVSPVVDLLTDITSFKDSKRNVPQFNHLCAVAEGIQAVGWVLVKKTPAPFVKEMLDSSMFFINRILKEFKDGDQKNVEWARQWKTILETMQTFVRQTHTTGLVWNSAPGCSPPASANAPATTEGRSGSGGPPPPPPPPPPSLLADANPHAAADSTKASRDALFAELNKGEAVTAGLRKVTADMQTHKNPALRESSRVTAEAVSHPAKSPAAPSPAVRRDPLIELKDGKQWNVEYLIGNRNAVVNVTDKKQTVYIFKCEDSVIVIKGKANSITLDSCRKTSVVFDALVAQCETINCQRIELQSLGEMPTLSIQKTDGCQVYLSEASKNAEVVTSKSSEMNLLIPKADGEFVEYPVPEQFKTTFDGAKLVTCVSDIA